MSNVRLTETGLQREANAFCRTGERGFRSDEELLQSARLLFRLRNARAEATEADVCRLLAALEKRVQRCLHGVLNRTRQTPLAKRLHGKRLSRLEREILLALACSALGMGGRIYDASDLMTMLRRQGRAGVPVLRALRPNGRLARGKLVSTESESAPVNRSISLEEDVLSDLLRPVRSPGPPSGQTKEHCKSIAKPRLKLHDLVLPDRVAQALHLALAQAAQHGTLFNDWGLGRVFPYGRAMTLLFSGPPGVGKTAAAEALAGELRKGLLVANYPDLVSCWMGVTEKNLASTFQDARRADAVLFWDEADSLFYQRKDTMRTWEISSVNVLLKEVEQFEGICILATNRPVTLDKALSRRIAVKVEFQRPDAALRKELWLKLLPKQLPLGDDVCVEQLSAADLSGGEIKNVVLNAARFALSRAAKGPVRMEDFQAALRLEKAGAGDEATGGRMGFQKAGDHGNP